MGAEAEGARLGGQLPMLERFKTTTIGGESHCRGTIMRLDKGTKTGSDLPAAGEMTLADLPDDCIACILGHTTPLDAVRLAGVCAAFQRAAQSNTLWHTFLPRDYAAICGPAAHSEPREAVMSLADGVLLDNGMQKYALLRRSGGVCRKLSVAAMDVAWGQDTRFWKWEQSRSSCFGKVAHLLAVCWLEVTGTWRCSLPPGSYTAVWRLRVANPQGGRFYFLSWKSPLSFSVATADGQTLEKKLNVAQLPGTGFEEWFEFEVGDVHVAGARGSVRELHLEYGIREIDCTYWKGGLFLDCLTLRPAGCPEDPRPPAKDRELGRIRGRTGVF